MKPSSLLGLLALTLIFSSACKKKKQDTEQPVEETPVPAPVISGYSQLKTGNYWIYGRYQVDANNTVTDMHQYDSSYVEKDTLIRNQTYYKLHKKDFSIGINVVLYLRDSLNYIVNPNGGVLFSSEDFTTVFTSFYIIEDTQPPDTVYKVTCKMSDKDFIVTVAAGTFITSNMQGTYTAPPSRLAPGIPNPRFLNMRYAKNTGLIVETEYFFASSPTITEKRLIRYHLN